MFELATWPRNPWSIFDELESLPSDTNQGFGGRGRVLPWRGGAAYPLINVWSAADGLVLDVELPGVDPKDVEISVTGDELTLRGKVNADEPEKETVYHRRERPTGTFQRVLQLPFRPDAAGVKAACRNGVLRLTVPRHEEEKPRKIAVQAN